VARRCGLLGDSVCVVALLCAASSLARADEVVDGGSAATPQVAPAKGMLDVLSNPAGVSVSIDGERIGVTPLVGIALAPGPHTVHLYGLDLKDQEQTVEVTAGQDVRLNFVLARVPAPGYSFLGTGVDIPLATAILAGTAAVLLGVGLGFGVAANDIQHQAGVNVSPSGVDLDLTRAEALQGKQYAYIANGMYIGAAAALTAAIVVALVTPRRVSDPAVKAPEASAPGGAPSAQLDQGRTW
jgi:PEGA domain